MKIRDPDFMEVIRQRRYGWVMLEIEAGEVISMEYFGDASRYNTPMLERDQVDRGYGARTRVRLHGAEVEEILKEAGYVLD